MRYPAFQGSVTSSRKVYTGALRMSTYDVITDLNTYVAPYLNEIKIALGVTEAGGALTSVTQLSVWEQGDLRIYTITAEVTV